MGMGYAFAAFLVLIVVVPIAGLVWFALDELLTHGGRDRYQRAVQRKTPPRQIG